MKVCTHKLAQPFLWELTCVRVEWVNYGVKMISSCKNNSSLCENILGQNFAHPKCIWLVFQMPCVLNVARFFLQLWSFYNLGLFFVGSGQSQSIRGKHMVTLSGQSTHNTKQCACWSTFFGKTRNFLDLVVIIVVVKEAPFWNVLVLYGQGHRPNSFRPPLYQRW